MNDAGLGRLGELEAYALGDGGDIAPAEVGIDDDGHDILRPGSRR